MTKKQQELKALIGAAKILEGRVKQSLIARGTPPPKPTLIGTIRRRPIVGDDGGANSQAVSWELCGSDRDPFSDETSTPAAVMVCGYMDAQRRRSR